MKCKFHFIVFKLSNHTTRTVTVGPSDNLQQIAAAISYQASDIVEAVDGKRRIVLDRVECDLYNYLSGKEEYAQLFKGSYLTNYSWGETTLGELESNRK